MINTWIYNNNIFIETNDNKKIQIINQLHLIILLTILVYNLYLYILFCYFLLITKYITYD